METSLNSLNEEKTAQEVTVAELDALCEKLAQKQLEKIEAEKIVLNINKEIAALEGRCANYLEELGREDYISKYGKGVIVEKWRVNMPATDKDKIEFFNHLKERGIFEKYASVHSGSLNSLYKADWEAAKQRGEGMEFFMPGISAPNVFKKFDFKIDKNWKKQNQGD